MTKLILALDMLADQAYDIIDKTQGLIDVYKITNQFMISAFNHYPYSDFVNFMNDNKTFVDLKLYDIPNTMINVLKEISEFEPFMTSIHAAADTRGLQDQFPDINLLGVSILTSFSTLQWYRNDFGSIEKNTETLLNKSFKDGLRGVVTDNSHANIAKEISSELITVCPGFDLNHISTLDKINVDYIVIGRAIIDSYNPIVSINLIKKYLGE